MNINSGFTVTLKNLKLINANSEDKGGAINNNGTLVLNNVTINNNKAKAGGAIYNTGTISMINSILSNNMAEGLVGGSYGGAIYNTGTINISYCKIINNTAAEYAGSIYNSGNMIIINFALTNSTSHNIGGIIYNDFGNLNVTGSLFENSAALTTETDNISVGGAICTIGNLIVNKCFFLGNNATYGGAIGTIMLEDPITYGNISITDSEFALNTAKNGGAISNMGNLNVKLCVFEYNTGNHTIRNSDASIGTVNADGNYWNNHNPTTDKLVNFNVNNYYVFSLGKNINIYTGTKVTLKLGLVLNTTKKASWTGIKLTAPYTTYTSKPTTTIKKITNDITTFTAKTKGNYYVTATTNGVKSTILIKVISKPVTVLKITSTTPRNGQKGYSQTKTIIITFNQKIKKSSKFKKIYIRNLNTKRRVGITTKIIGNKLYIKMKAKRYKHHYYRIYIPKYAVINSKKKTISKTIKFRT